MKIRLLQAWLNYPHGVVIDVTSSQAEMLLARRAAVLVEKVAPEIKQIKSAPMDKQIKSAATKTTRKRGRPKRLKEAEHGS